MEKITEILRAGTAARLRAVEESAHFEAVEETPMPVTEPTVKAEDFANGLADLAFDGPVPKRTRRSGLTGGGLMAGASEEARERVAQFLVGLAAEASAKGALIDPQTLRELSTFLALGAEPTWLGEVWMTPRKMAPMELASLKRHLAAETFEAMKRSGAIKTRETAAAVRKLLLNGDIDGLKASMPSVFIGEAASAMARLTLSWDYVFACDADRTAMMKLAASLDALSPEEYPEIWSTGSKVLAVAWRTLASTVSSKGNESFDEIQDRIRRSTINMTCLSTELEKLELVQSVPNAPPNVSEPGGMKPETSNPRPGTKTMVVLDAVGDPQSEAGREASQRYSALRSAVELRGAADPDEVYRILQREFPWMTEANRKAAECVGMCRYAELGYFLAKPIMLVGDPGVGKTRWARRLAEVVGVPFGSMSLSGSTSSMAINGAERGWSTGLPCYPARVINGLRVANPVVLVDEADKASSSSNNGNALDALLPLLEAETARRHYDAYLMGHLDLSKVTWVFSVNTLAGLPAPLMSRFPTNVIHVGRPSAKHLDAIVPAMLADIAKRYDIPTERLPDIDDALPAIRRAFEAEPSLRNLSTEIENAIKAAVWRPMGPKAVA